ncbi:hypothetical protein COO60DRAFT_1501723 [Scenedesmus sp. NREL 46B-D3]|nr:hypothetical protein COO60DRAFT_1501723 [Scenedesmus sp. NREL 46B-D3]
MHSLMPVATGGSEVLLMSMATPLCVGFGVAAVWRPDRVHTLFATVRRLSRGRMHALLHFSKQGLFCATLPHSMLWALLWAHLLGAAVWLSIFGAASNTAAVGCCCFCTYAVW